jgi:sugar phosphate isomerase/epimerase
MRTILYFCVFFISLSSFSQDQFGGVALYTLREDMGTNPKKTLKEVSTIGYSYIEAAGYANGKFYGMEPKEFSALLSEYNLIPVSTHQGTVTLDNMSEMIDDVKQAGFEYFVIPVPPMGMFYFDEATMSMGMNGTIEELASILNQIGEKCKDAGLSLLYHNHDFEFIKNEEGVAPIDYLLENCNPEWVNFQMDLFWVNRAQVNPVDYFEKYPGRFKIWHVKDMNDQGLFAPVGEGNIDFAKILKHKELSGMLYYMVEQDMTFDLKPLDAVKISHNNLKNIGFN